MDQALEQTLQVAAQKICKHPNWYIERWTAAVRWMGRRWILHPQSTYVKTRS